MLYQLDLVADQIKEKIVVNTAEGGTHSKTSEKKRDRFGRKSTLSDGKVVLMEIGGLTVSVDSLREGIDRMDVRLETQITKMDERFEKQDAKMDERFAKQDAKIDQLFEKQDAKMDERFAKQDAKIDQLFEKQDTKMDRIYKEMHRLYEKHDTKIANLEKLAAQQICATDALTKNMAQNDVRLCSLETRVLSLEKKIFGATAVVCVFVATVNVVAKLF